MATATVKIRMTTTAAGPDGVWPAGSDVEVDRITAAQLVAGGYATATDAGAQTATADPVERTAVLPRPNRRRAMANVS